MIELAKVYVINLVFQTVWVVWFWIWFNTAEKWGLCNNAMPAIILILTKLDPTVIIV